MMSTATTTPGEDGPTSLPIGSATTDATPRARRRRSGPDFGSRSNPAPRAPLTEDRRGLAERYMPLAGSMARRAASGWASGADHEFRSAAAMALVEAARNFDEARGVGFATFARHRIRGAITDAARGLAAERGEWAGPIDVLVGKGRIRGVLCGMTADGPVGEEMERREAVESCIRRLSAEQATAVRLIYFRGLTQEEAAALMGLSKATMCRLHRDALERLAAMRGRLLAAG